MPLGVVFALSTRELRFPDLGVILLFKKADTGVDIPSLAEAAGVIVSGRGPRRGNGVVAATGGPAPATLGVNGVLLADLALALRVGMSGLAAWLLLCLSKVEGMVFALPLFAVKGAGRIIAF